MRTDQGARAETVRRPLHWSRQWRKWTWRREVRFWINSEGGTDRFADRSNEEGGEQKSICYESILEKLRNFAVGVKQCSGEKQGFWSQVARVQVQLHRLLSFHLFASISPSVTWDNNCTSFTGLLGGLKVFYACKMIGTVPGPVCLVLVTVL